MPPSTTTRSPVNSGDWFRCKRRPRCSFFTRHGRYRAMIHGFKYHGQWKTCLRLGAMFGAEPVRKRPVRHGRPDRPRTVALQATFPQGLQPAEYLARGIAGALGRKTDCRSLVRKSYNRSQTAMRNRKDRWGKRGGHLFGTPSATAGRTPYPAGRRCADDRFDADRLRRNHPESSPFVPHQHRYAGRFGDGTVRGQRTGRTLTGSGRLDKIPTNIHINTVKSTAPC